MKTKLILAFALSVLAANAFAVPATEQNLSAEARDSASVIAQPLKTLAEGAALASDRLWRGVAA